MFISVYSKSHKIFRNFNVNEISEYFCNGDNDIVIMKNGYVYAFNIKDKIVGQLNKLLLNDK
jgi:hypothetical protein